LVDPAVKIRMGEELMMYFRGVQILANVAVVDGEVVNEHLIRNIAMVGPPNSL